MVQIGEYEFAANARYQSNKADATVVVDVYEDITDEMMVGIKSADCLRAYTTFDDKKELVAEYALIYWKSIEKTPDGYRFIWQTYQSTEIESLRQENADLTDAVLELAAIIGGEGNG